VLTAKVPKYRRAPVHSVREFGIQNTLNICSLFKTTVVAKEPYFLSLADGY
jgi:hypothetical protein